MLQLSQYPFLLPRHPQGDRRANSHSGLGLSSFNIENQYGEQALKTVLEEIHYGHDHGGSPAFVSPTHHLGWRFHISSQQGPSVLCA
jgi:hypothetical protein